jgi:3-oxoacyl-[acyl-carrier protein] reductase
MTALAAQVAVVTGRAGDLGEAICIGLAQPGCAVVVGYNHSQAPAQDLVRRLPPASQPLTDSAESQALADEVQRRYGRCDILVNCAGTTRFVAHADRDGLDDGLIEQIMSTNVRGPFAAVRALKGLLAARRHDGCAGLVVNISSIAAVTAMGSKVMYCASKAALDNMTRSLARALAPAVRVLSVSSGLANTEFVKSMDRGWRDEPAARTPLRRPARPEDVAAAVRACATQLSFSAGTVLAVVGGRPLS